MGLSVTHRKVYRDMGWLLELLYSLELFADTVNLESVSWVHYVKHVSMDVARRESLVVL